MIKDCVDFTTDKYSDRKLLEESSDIFDSSLEMIEKDKPDVLLISGDLTKDGEEKCEREVAAKLKKLQEKLKTQGKDLKIYVINGNHDINNSNGKDFSTGVAVPAEKTSPMDFKEIYQDISYKDAIDTFTPSNGQAGGLSYVASPKEGFSFIVIDTGKYSADSTSTKTDEHETSGAISNELKEWVIKHIKEEKAKGNTVIGLEHHGIVPHFDSEPKVLSEYLIDNYDTISREFADAGLKYMFTGHMHSNDISKLTTDKGNELYDIETGSLVTYPCPTRSIEISRDIKNNKLEESLKINTNLIKSTSFIDKSTGKSISNLTEYSKKYCKDYSLFTTLATKYGGDFIKNIEFKGGIKKYLDDILKQDTGDYVISKLKTMLPTTLDAAMDVNNKIKVYYDIPNKRIVLKGKSFYSKGTLFITEDNIKTEIVENLLNQIDTKILQDSNYVNKLLSDTVTELLNMEVYSDGNTKKIVSDLIDSVYLTNLAGEEVPEEWCTIVSNNSKNTILINNMLDILLNKLTSVVNEFAPQLKYNAKNIINKESGLTSSAMNLVVEALLGDDLRDIIKLTKTDVRGKLGEISTKALPNEKREYIGNTLGDVIISMTHDNNYKEDNNTTIKTQY